MQNNIVVIPKCASSGILESIDKHSLINGFVGNVSNLWSNYLNDFGNTNSEISEYINDNKAFLNAYDIESILDNPDYIIEKASDEFYQALRQLWKSWGSCDKEEAAVYTMRHANMYFDSWGKYYLFVMPISNACHNEWLIRAENEQEALNWLLCEFENAFSIDSDDVNDDSIYNDNGIPCNIDNLVLIGTIDPNN